jgi:hypothetical protein
MHDRMNRGWFCLALLAAALAVAGCTATGQLNFLGYTTEPNYDPSIRTVYVPRAQNLTFILGLEDYLTRAVIREIMSKTPFQIASCRETADTELDLKITTWRKSVIIPTQTNQVRQAELGLGIEVVWRDLRPGKLGEILSNPKGTLSQEPPLPGMEPTAPGKALPVLLLPVANYEPELGGSNAVAQKVAIDRVAVQIVSMMEKGW